MDTKKQHAGFTLLELVLAIVIITVLAVTAMLKSGELKTDTNIATIRAMGGTIKALSDMVYAKAVMQNVEKLPLSNVDLDGDGVSDIETKYGYPSASRGNGLSKVIGGDYFDSWTWSTTYSESLFYTSLSDIAGPTGQYVNQVPFLNTNCYLTYAASTGVNDLPNIEYELSGC